MTDHVDLFGQPLAIGDYVTYAASLGRCPILKVGKVTSLKSRVDPYKSGKTKSTIGVRTVEFTSEWREQRMWKVQNSGKELTLGFLDRLIKVDPTMLPEQCKQALDEV